MSASSAARKTPPAPVALVTGGARRLGRAIALALAADGWDIGLHHHRSRDEARRTVAEIEALGRRAVALPADLSRERAARELLPRCAARLGAVSCLVNNASLFAHDTAAQAGAASVLRHMTVNCVAPLLLAQALAAQLPPRRQGVVINLLDQKLWNPNPDHFSYSLSKRALEEATTLLALALAPRLRVVGVAPGLTLPSDRQDSAAFERTHRMAPLGRSSTPEDIAGAVVYLARARAVTGTTLLVDGGQHLARQPRDFSFL